MIVIMCKSARKIYKSGRKVFISSYNFIIPLSQQNLKDKPSKAKEKFDKPIVRSELNYLKSRKEMNKLDIVDY